MSYDIYNQQQNNGFNPYEKYEEPYKAYNEPSFPHAGATTVRVKRTLFIPTGRYNQQFRRPWVAAYNRDNAQAVHDAVGQAYRHHAQAKADGRIDPNAKYMVDPMDLAAVSSGFIMPAAQTEVAAHANIMGGWGEQTGRFMMNIEVKLHQAVAPTEYVLIGYTNYVGFTESGYVSPDMELNINTIFQVRQVEVNNGYGVVMQSQLVNVNQVLVDQQYTDPNTAQTIRLRPFEVAASLARMTDPLLQQTGVVAIDTRDTQNGTPAFSDQHNTNPNDYMAKVISGLVSGRDFATTTGRSGVMEPYHQAGRLLRDAPATKDPFIMAISRAADNGNYSSTFKWRDLLRVDPNAGDNRVCIVQWRRLEQYANVMGESMTMANEHATSWNNRDLTAQVASQIANMLPAMMIDLALMRVTVVASNASGQHLCTVPTGSGLIQNVNQTAQLQALANMFFQQLVRPATFDGEIFYNMTISADLSGEVVINIRLGNSTEDMYVMPAYCSSVVSPVLTTQRDTLDNLANAFHDLQATAFPAQPVQPLIHDLGGATTTGKRY